MERMKRNMTNVSQIHESHSWTWACLQQVYICCQTDFCSIFGYVYDATVAHPDPENVNAAHKLLAPKPATQLQTFLRLVTYLSPFIPSLSSFTTPLHGLLKKGTKFFWNNSCQEVFDKVKSLICKGYHTAVLWCLQACHCPSWCHPKKA